MGEKHAYLIIAHNRFTQLNYLVSLLDDFDNDIFILVDKKAGDIGEVQSMIKASAIKSRVIFIRQINIYWGNYSLIDAEIRLFEAAFNKNNFRYEYYHLISGQDLPIVSQKMIKEFFHQNKGKIFIAYGKKAEDNKVIDRVKFYHISTKFTGRSGNKSNLINKAWRLIDKINVLFQSFIGIDKVKKYSLNVDYASNWVSLDADTVQLILKNESWIKKVFAHSVACDEVFLPVLINKLNIGDKVFSHSRLDDDPASFQANLRYINWWDGDPYTWQDGDENEILSAINNGHFFSRKFDINKSPKLKRFLDKTINSSSESCSNNNGVS